ncbi:hypothetical protein Val02_81140 [Virgisporangium aliadipatigenens]|uniref:Uncharacterized protein n=1 Tax=Virgisporangium aliadipatigenens TaxID=741659 RepID=A0A8J3YVE1_9ACTN|nr:hypothetical protein [Virgisporangium aliadipatigenens]GIJ51228.1 hypothetical protein Val02_81140 [Virgisporangium aliadipatigenens]
MTVEQPLDMLALPHHAVRETARTGVLVLVDNQVNESVELVQRLLVRVRPDEHLHTFGDIQWGLQAIRHLFDLGEARTKTELLLRNAE